MTAARTALAAALTLAATSAPAQTPPDPNATAIRRSTAAAAPSLGEFSEDAGTPAPPPRPRVRGDVGGTGTVATEPAPQGNLRGSTQPAPGEIDFTHPIGAADVARLLQMQEPQLRACYDAARATRPQLTGRVALRFVVSRTGELTDVDVRGFPDVPTVAPCMATALRQVRFPRPESGVLPFNRTMNFAPPVTMAPAAAPRSRRR